MAMEPTRSASMEYVSYRNVKGQTHLHTATEDELGKLQHHWAKLTDVERLEFVKATDCNGDTALTTCTCLAVIKYVVKQLEPTERTQVINLRNKRGQTILHLQRDVKIVDYLVKQISSQEQVEELIMSLDENERNALFYCDYAVAELLINKLQSYSKEAELVNHVDRFGMIPLYHEREKQRKEKFELLLKYLTHVNSQGNNLIMHLVTMEIKRNSNLQGKVVFEAKWVLEKVVEWLIEGNELYPMYFSSTTTLFQLEQTNKEGQNIIHLVALTQNYGLCSQITEKWILTAENDETIYKLMSAQDEHGNNPLMYLIALQTNVIGTSQLLIRLSFKEKLEVMTRRNHYEVDCGVISDLRWEELKKHWKELLGIEITPSDESSDPNEGLLKDWLQILLNVYDLDSLRLPYKSCVNILKHFNSKKVKRHGNDGNDGHELLVSRNIIPVELHDKTASQEMKKQRPILSVRMFELTATNKESLSKEAEDLILEFAHNNPDIPKVLILTIASSETDVWNYVEINKVPPDFHLIILRVEADSTELLWIDLEPMKQSRYAVLKITEVITSSSYVLQHIQTISSLSRKMAEDCLPSSREVINRPAFQGKALIICTTIGREGYEEQLNNILHAFQALMIQVKLLPPNIPATSVSSCVKKFLKEEADDTLPLMVVIVSHGASKNVIFDSENQPFNLQEVLDILDKDKIQAKLLMVFPLCCRGTCREPALAGSGELKAANSFFDLVYENPPKQKSDKDDKNLGRSISLPTNTIIIFPTLEDRPCSRGAFSKAFWEIIQEHVKGLSSQPDESSDTSSPDLALRRDIFSFMREVLGELRTQTKVRQLGLMISTHNPRSEPPPTFLITTTPKKQFACISCVLKEHDVQAECKCPPK